jgi:SAM-dependent methyltransferase
MGQSVERFSSRIDDYIKYRPGYPSEIIRLLKRECCLDAASVVADIGSGTGKLSELFLDNGNKVFGVEPNSGMRAAAEVVLQRFQNFVSIDGTAESTTLPDASVDFITAGQAFHWFDPNQFKLEANRILRAAGWVVLTWNARRLVSTPFLEEYERLLLQYGTDYQDIRHEKAEDLIAGFFTPGPFSVAVFQNQQNFDYEGLTGRVRSSSYTPEPGHPAFAPMIDDLRILFQRHQQNGRVVFEYDTKVFYGQIAVSKNKI